MFTIHINMNTLKKQDPKQADTASFRNIGNASWMNKNTSHGHFAINLGHALSCEPWCLLSWCLWRETPETDAQSTEPLPWYRGLEFAPRTHHGTSHSICTNAAKSLTSQRKVSMFSSACSITYLKMMGKELFRKGMGTDLSSKAEQNRAQKSFFTIYLWWILYILYIYYMAYF